jgi:hypothetical protein
VKFDDKPKNGFNWHPNGYINEEIDKIKRASPLAKNLGPGISNFGLETFKLLRM